MTVAVFSLAECMEYVEKQQRWCWDTTVCMQAVINKPEKNLSDSESSAHFIIWKKKGWMKKKPWTKAGIICLIIFPTV